MRRAPGLLHRRALRPAALALSVLMLSACALVPLSERTRQALPEHNGPVFEMHNAAGKPAGWLYGSVHVGSAERPAFSQQALVAMSQTRHVYLEVTDGSEDRWDMAQWKAEDFHPAPEPRLSEAQMTEVMGQEVDIVEARRERTFEVQLAGYCGLERRFGSENTALKLLAGRSVQVGGLETTASRERDEKSGPQDPVRRADEESQVRAAMADAIAGLMQSPNYVWRADQDPRLRVLDAMCRLFSTHPEQLASLVQAMPAGTYRARERTMAKGVVAAVERGERPFVIVGAMHLLGEGSMPALLAEQGITVRPMGSTRP
ncbi:TraB/GumN family protein [Uliginosibacterium sp. H1]|uniref:TraB/GumN family protein n=1 Tax=Uliginosibacterium sp. H1 TaxID=3114757 RepID=UPI002E18FFA7|nr:TraB/GumN family protein [Uliginosibacterium sp. H1]